MPERIGGDAKARLLLEGNTKKSGVHIGGKAIWISNNRNAVCSPLLRFSESAY